MPDLKLDLTTGDLAVTAGDLSLTEAGDEDTAQALHIRLRMFRGEWFLDTRKGLPFLESILVKNPDPATVEALLRAEIAATEGVDAILAFALNYNPATRKIAPRFTVRSTDGSTVTV